MTFNDRQLRIKNISILINLQDLRVAPLVSREVQNLAHLIGSHYDLVKKGALIPPPTMAFHLANDFCLDKGMIGTTPTGE
jgi:hypothetical protein